MNIACGVPYSRAVNPRLHARQKPKSLHRNQQLRKQESRSTRNLLTCLTLRNIFAKLGKIGSCLAKEVPSSNHVLPSRRTFCEQCLEMIIILKEFIKQVHGQGKKEKEEKDRARHMSRSQGILDHSKAILAMGS